MRFSFKRGAGSQSPGSAPAAAGGLRWQRYVRKVHLYLGLVMWPFVVLFALSALSFNHPATARGFTQLQISATEVEAETGFSPPNAHALAAAFVAELNRSAHANPAAIEQAAATGRYELEGTPSFSGWALFAAPVADGKQALILSLDSGWVEVTHRPSEASEHVAPFDGWRSTHKPFDLDALSDGLGRLLEHRGVGALGPVRVHPEVHPELRFGVRDDHGVLWQSKLDLVSGELRATRAEGTPSRFADLIERIHTQHHYPAQRDATWLWALFADLTALTLILWALTGLFMWWQQRKLRQLGGWLVVLALTGAGLLMSSVVNHQSFGPSSEAE